MDPSKKRTEGKLSGLGTAWSPPEVGMSRPGARRGVRDGRWRVLGHRYAPSLGSTVVVRVSGRPKGAPCRVGRARRGGDGTPARSELSVSTPAVGVHQGDLPRRPLHPPPAGPLTNGRDQWSGQRPRGASCASRALRLGYSLGVHSNSGDFRFESGL